MNLLRTLYPAYHKYFHMIFNNVVDHFILSTNQGGGALVTTTCESSSLFFSRSSFL